MLIDTHCHINTMVKSEFDILLKESDYAEAKLIIDFATTKSVHKIINVGTSLPESLNCISLAKRFEPIYATIGIHPNDLNENWQEELKTLAQYLPQKEDHKIIGIGECGLDLHYPNYNLQRQIAGFRAQIELALNYNLPLSVHTRNAPQETLKVLEEYVQNKITGVIHCFSEGLDFAKEVTSWGFVMGIGGTITYPKNNFLREVVTEYSLSNIVLETDAPFLPIQAMRGKTNHPVHIYEIAEYIANLKSVDLTEVAQKTAANVQRIFKI